MGCGASRVDAINENAHDENYRIERSNRIDREGSFDDRYNYEEEEEKVSQDEEYENKENNLTNKKPAWFRMVKKSTEEPRGEQAETDKVKGLDCSD